MERSDWLLVVLGVANCEPLTPVQLQKSLFLLGQAKEVTKSPAFYNFAPYHYGPFDPSIYADTERLSKQGLVAISHRPGTNWSEYATTTAGQEKAEEIRSHLSGPVLNYAEAVVKWVRAQTFQSLLSAIYNKYPEFRQNSVFQE